MKREESNKRERRPKEECERTKVRKRDMLGSRAVQGKDFMI
jgi:hypothetical protein